jgi:hypothetical protein
MKIRHLTSGAVLVAVLAGAGLGSPTPAAAKGTASQTQSSDFNSTAEADMLRNAYNILSTGDHDYKGHRVRAMAAVKAAADLLGMKLSGDGKDKEQQVLSDDKLKEAQGLLQQVLSASGVQARPKVTKHINTAIEQITIALSIK